MTARRITAWMVAIGLVCGCVLVPAGCRRRAAPAAVPPAVPRQPAAPTNAQEMAYQRMHDAAYTNLLTKLGEVRNEKARALAGIRGQLVQIETRVGTNTPAMDQLRREIESLHTTLAEKEAALALAVPYKQDSEWQKLNAEAQRAQTEVDEAQAAVQKLVQERMKRQYAEMEAAYPNQYGRPARLQPPGGAQNTNLNAMTAALLHRPPIVVSPRPAMTVATNAGGSGSL